MSSDDALKYLPVEKWEELQKAFEVQWPLGISAYYALQTQRELLEHGLGYGFKVYCPYGDVTSGMVALNTKDTFNEIVIQCPEQDTTKLENALVATKIIDWSKPVIVPCLPRHTFECLKNAAARLNMLINDGEKEHPPHDLVVFDKNKQAFENISLPDGVTFGPVLEDHVDMVDSVWPNRYDGSKWFFRLLIKIKNAFGLFKDRELVSCVFISELGFLTHLYTFENHRQKGYGKMLMKLVCNRQLKEKKNTFGYCKRGNVSALNLYESLGFEKFHPVQWCYMQPKQN